MGCGVAKNEIEAVRFYKLATEQGQVDAQFSLGVCYADGTGVTKDEQEVVSLYKLAADQEHKPATEKLFQITQK